MQRLLPVTGWSATRAASLLSACSTIALRRRAANPAMSFSTAAQAPANKQSSGQWTRVGTAVAVMLGIATLLQGTKAQDRLALLEQWAEDQLRSVVCTLGLYQAQLGKRPVLLPVIEHLEREREAQRKATIVGKLPSDPEHMEAIFRAHSPTLTRIHEYLAETEQSHEAPIVRRLRDVLQRQEQQQLSSSSAAGSSSSSSSSSSWWSSSSSHSKQQQAQGQHDDPAIPLSVVLAGLRQVVAELETEALDLALPLRLWPQAPSSLQNPDLWKDYMTEMERKADLLTNRSIGEARLSIDFQYDKQPAVAPHAPTSAASSSATAVDAESSKPSSSGTLVA
ncbi:hypothetical protein CAOG_00705 [Capsaspora owczarzaki ATCC 30864]|uniref:Uncharacterized protein n=1 Tax=Capsaspora owczarzaki (strain ATCC 30864) TaxID=595528 RepID=A0A0D2WHQ6_CAPO3|nr:hypothetical protein CAOG_00705 [Capsaspora owczarzaki ATCC 30864]KJE89185.1 hypothetical protein CAOG_000705 [Capsaspora owczarzaki ATCC 30864]|eukprot:XP_004365576.1 hypothetical protein CAOG_00705 [Capsaspora owczarzaki ATCC 30864]